jgi:serine/threonine protein kinase
MTMHSCHVDRQTVAIVTEFVGTVSTTPSSACAAAVLDVVQAAQAVPFPGPSWRQVARVFQALVTALQQVHSRGYLHMDIHPGNVLMGSFNAPQSLRLVDFGSAQRMYDVLFLCACLCVQVACLARGSSCLPRCFLLYALLNHP